MLTVAKISKAYAGRVLFEDTSLQVNRGDRIGLIGPNGAGKSTLFSLILGENTPDEGTVSWQRGCSVGFLPQESAPSGNESILELATSISSELAATYRVLRDNDNPDSEEYHQALADFAHLDGHALQVKAKRIMAGLAFRETDFDRPAKTMSGGWIMRAHLTRLLVQEPDLLLLDEPTNHLDLESLGWFQNYLKTYPGAILAISHDREFLNVICESILEISQKRLFRYTGNYEKYLELKAAREAQHLSAYKNQQREIESLQRFADRFRAKASKAAQAQEKLKQIARMEKIEAPPPAEATVKFRFPQPARSGHQVAVLQHVEQAYGDLVVYRDLNLVVERGQRTVLVGPNGAGKSTLLKILAGLTPIRSGDFKLGHNVSVGYFAQQRTEVLDLRRTVLDEAKDLPQSVPEQTIRTILGSFLFRGDDVFKTVGVLSGGEKSRLALVKLLLNPPNLLLLDEPTTHLDMASIDALIQALSGYEGTLLFVSHDVHFIRSMAKTVTHIQAGVVTHYPGDYQYYLDKSKASSARDGLVANFQPSQSPALLPVSEPVKASIKEIREARKQEAQKRQELNKKRRELERVIAGYETQIFTLEEQQKTITKALEDPLIYSEATKAMDLNQQLRSLQERLEQANDAWSRAADSLAQFEETEASLVN